MSQYINDIKYLSQQAPLTYAILAQLRNGYKRPAISKSLNIPTWKYDRTLQYACIRYHCNSYYQLICKASEAGAFDG